MDTELPFLDEYLRNETLGHYKANLALIALSPRASFWLPENPPTLDRWCVFAHEYAHFLHNFSTTCGLYDFVTHLRLVGLFVQTVGVDGNSRGMDVLDEQQRRDFHKWQTLRQHLRGQTGHPFSPDYHRRDVQIRVTDVKTSRGTVEFSTQAFPLQMETAYVSFSVWSASTPPQSCSIAFGGWHIMEALAYEIERTIFKANGADVGVIDSRMPTYPYKLGRLLFEHLAKVVPSERAFARVCVMALQSTDPGASFIDIANAFGRRSPSESDEITLSRLEGITLRELHRTVAHHINLTLRPEFDRFASRGGPVGRAIASLGAMCLKYVELRTKDLFFEIRLFEQVLDRDSLHQIIQSYPPCPIVHDARMDGNSEFFNLSATELSADEVDALCAYQSFSEFIAAHLRQDKFLRTGECRHSRCLFLGACAAPQAIHTPELCRTQPWSAFREGDSQACMYAAAVSAARGRADL